MSDANQETATDHCTDGTEHEYRVFGFTEYGWRKTEWSSRERAEHVYEECEWAGKSFERRAIGDDSTIERKSTLSDDEWMKVTDDMVRPDDERRASA